MSKCTLRQLFTTFMYTGLVICFVPYLSGANSKILICLVIGGAIAIVSGVFRCYYSEGDTPEQHISSKPCP